MQGWAKLANCSGSLISSSCSPLCTGFLPDGSALSSFRLVSAFRRAGGLARLSGLQAKAQAPPKCVAAPAPPQLTYSLRWLAEAPAQQAAASSIALLAAGHKWTLDSGKQK